MFTEWEKRTSQTGIIVRVRATHRRCKREEQDSRVEKFSFGKFSIICLSLSLSVEIFPRVRNSYMIELGRRELRDRVEDFVKEKKKRKFDLTNLNLARINEFE